MRAITIPILTISLLAIACSSGGGGGDSAEVTIQGQNEVPVGGSVQLDAATSNGSDSGYDWTSSNPGVAMVDGSGVVTGVSKGDVTITAEGLQTGAEGQYLVKVNFDPSEDVPFYDEWAASGHADTTAEAFTHWDDDGAVPANCAKCHSRFGFHDFLGEDGSTPGQVDSDHPTGSVVDCVTCHNESTLALSDVTFPSGVTVEVDGREATCMNCHQGRASTDSVDAAILAANPADDDEILPDQGFINVHYFPAAATRYGGQVRGGYLYDGRSYDVRFRHVEGAHDCQECHNPHTLELRLDDCQECHTGVSQVSDTYNIRMVSSATRDYDGDGERKPDLLRPGRLPVLLQRHQRKRRVRRGRGQLRQPVPGVDPGAGEGRAQLPAQPEGAGRVGAQLRLRRPAPLRLHRGPRRRSRGRKLHPSVRERTKPGGEPLGRAAPFLSGSGLRAVRMFRGAGRFRPQAAGRKTVAAACATGTKGGFPITKLSAAECRRSPLAARGPLVKTFPPCHNAPMKTAREIMTTDLITVTPSTPIREFARMCAEDDISGAPVLNLDGSLAGMVSKTDLLEHLIESDPTHVGEAESFMEVWLGEDQSVNEIMIEDVISVIPDAPVAEVAALMAENRIHRVAVIEDDKCVGIITSLDLLQHFGG